jgi:hypothetical protein
MFMDGSQMPLKKIRPARRPAPHVAQITSKGKRSFIARRCLIPDTNKNNETANAVRIRISPNSICGILKICGVLGSKKKPATVLMQHDNQQRMQHIHRPRFFSRS